MCPLLSCSVAAYLPGIYRLPVGTATHICMEKGRVNCWETEHLIDTPIINCVSGSELSFPAKSQQKLELGAKMASEQKYLTFMSPNNFAGCLKKQGAKVQYEKKALQLRMS